MKSTRAFKILSIALAAAVVFYFLVQGVRYLTNPYATTRVYTSTTEESVEASGWLVREEEAFRSEAGTLSHTRDEGEKVGKGQVIATAYDSPGALEAVAQIQAKRLQLEQLEYALSSYLNPDAALKLDGSISDDIMALRKNLTGGDYTAASGDLSQLKAAIVKRSRAYTSSQEIKTEIAAVQDEIDSLQAGLTGATDITAPRAGTYSAVCDGYESVLTEAFLEDVTPSKLNGVKAAAEQSNVGKLIYGDTWYYAVVLPAEQAAALKDMGRVDVRLAKGFDQSIRMSVVSVSREENGQAAVVLSSTRYLAQTTLLRHQAADAVLHTYQGLRVPADALRVSADGTTGVYCVDGENASFRPIELVYQGEGYALVKPAEGVRDTQTLRSGDQVIATSGELYDGKVIR